MSRFNERSNPRSSWLVTNYDQVLPTELTNEVLSSAVRLLLDRLSEAGWERAGWVIHDCITCGDFSRLCNYDPDVLDLTTSDVYTITQCLAFFKKRQDIELGIDRRAAALEKFEASERDCMVTNSCFRAWSQGRFQFRPGVESVLHRAQRKVSDLLDSHFGGVPAMREIRQRFGPGSTTQTKKENACPVVKLKSMPACSANFNDVEAALATSFVTTSVIGEFGSVEIHPAKLSFVPKNAKTERSICTEPALNGMFQLGLGDSLACALRRVGIDIKDQSRNQRAALYGSISGATATLDLSSASDTVSIGLVEHLFPLDWFDLFMQLRSAEVCVGNGLPRTLSKISSMGNGFTFPLETIIFWALAQSVTDIYAPRSQRPVLVYGDDIIVPTECAAPLLETLRAVGFTPNASKSFWSGPFRESCGADFHLGVNVRPVFVDDALTGADFFRLHNYFFARGDSSLCALFSSWIHPSCKLLGPPGFGDGHLHVNALLYRDSLHAVTRKGWGGVTFESWAYSARRLRDDIAKSLATIRGCRVPIWDPELRRWSPTNFTTVRRVVYHERHEFVVRRLATYTQAARETRTLTLTRCDAAMNCGQHVYSDRRMPDPVDRTDDDAFVVPGVGEVIRAKIYIFEPPLA